MPAKKRTASSREDVKDDDVSKRQKTAEEVRLESELTQVRQELADTKEALRRATASSASSSSSSSSTSSSSSSSSSSGGEVTPKALQQMLKSLGKQLVSAVKKLQVKSNMAKPTCEPVTLICPNEAVFKQVMAVCEAKNNNVKKISANISECYGGEWLEMPPQMTMKFTGKSWGGRQSKAACIIDKIILKAMRKKGVESVVLSVKAKVTQAYGW
jgi:hypothetical protein